MAGQASEENVLFICPARCNFPPPLRGPPSPRERARGRRVAGSLACPLALSLGDPAGIGPEIVVKACAPCAKPAPPSSSSATRVSRAAPVRAVADLAHGAAVFADAIPVLDLPTNADIVAGRPTRRRRRHHRLDPDWPNWPCSSGRGRRPRHRPDRQGCAALRRRLPLSSATPSFYGETPRRPWTAPVAAR